MLNIVFHDVCVKGFFDEGGFAGPGEVLEVGEEGGLFVAGDEVGFAPFGGEGDG